MALFFTRTDKVSIDASIDVVKSREAGREILSAFVSAFVDDRWLFQVDPYVDSYLTMTPDVEAAIAFFLKLQEGPKRWIRGNRGITGGMQAEIELFCDVAYWSIGIDVFGSPEWPVPAISGADGGQFLRYEMPTAEVPRFVDALGSLASLLPDLEPWRGGY
jgi:hypothetical protein